MRSILRAGRPEAQGDPARTAADIHPDSGEADFRRIADVQRTVTPGDARLPADQGTREHRVADMRPVIDDRVLEKRALDDAPGADGQVRPEDGGVECNRTSAYT